MKSKKRYECLVFPGLYGNPIYTDSFLFAYTVSAIRSLMYIEARIIDRKTGAHVVW